MEIVILGIIGVAIIGGVLFLLKKKKIIGGSKEDYVLKGDPQAQKDYEMANSPAVILNHDEKEELSWQFLYELTDHVMANFSQEDQDKLQELGQKMQESGIQYEHVVKLGIRPEYMQKLEAEMSIQKKSSAGRHA